MDIFNKKISVKGIFERLLSISIPIHEGSGLKYEAESELNKSLVPGLIRIKNNRK